MQRTNLPDNKGFDFKIKQAPGKGLSGRFIFPPFSVFRTTDGDWLRRKRQWIALGIESEIGRGDAKVFGIGNKTEWEKGLLKDKKQVNPIINEIFGGNKNAGNIQSQTGTSIFDPVLCELMYSWFCPEGGQIVDPFAGGSVRGLQLFIWV